MKVLLPNESLFFSVSELEKLMTCFKDCGAITMGSSADCDNMPAGGTRARLILFNYDDVAPGGIVTDSEGRVTDINLNVGKYAYAFYGFRNDTKKIEEIVTPDVGPPRVKQTTGMTVYERTQEQKNNMMALVKGRVMAVVELLGDDDDRLILLGKKVGLRIVPGVMSDAHANGGFFIFTVATADGEGEYESAFAPTIGGTYAAGLAIVNALLPASELEP